MPQLLLLQHHILITRSQAYPRKISMQYTTFSYNTLSKGTVAMARANKTPEMEERRFEKLRQLIENYNILVLQLLVQWPMVTIGIWNTASNKFPLCLIMASEKSLWLIIIIISNTEKGDQSSSALLSSYLVSEQQSTSAKLLCRVAKIDPEAFYIYWAQD